MEEEVKGENKKRERVYFCRREFLTKYKVANKHPKLVYFGAPITG